MMRGNNIQMTTKVKKVDLLAKLQENASRHSQIVQDEWSWTAGFFGSTRRLSKMSDDYAAGKGY